MPMKRARKSKTKMQKSPLYLPQKIRQELVRTHGEVKVLRVEGRVLGEIILNKKRFTKKDIIYEVSRRLALGK